ncbi:MAG TPA: HEAT repeat domain-containing protein, partial [Burkholderiales bacterium]|nr:HEAT repeat domain-containing protein [Burkholderiales bacterium]
MKTTIAIALIAIALAPAAASAQARSEQQLLAVLSSSASLQEKDVACAELKRVGTAISVPVLAGLLSDPNLSHSARYALESMPFPEAGLALLEALDKTTGLLKTGIIHSLGRRLEARAVSALVKALDDADPNVARAAATALGHIGGTQATEALFSVVTSRRESGQRGAALDALLAAADTDLGEGRTGEAKAVFEKLRTVPAPDHVRAAAYRGMIMTATPGRAAALVKAALQGGNSSDQMAALEAAGGLKGADVTKVLCESLAKAAPPLKTALIEALRERGDPAAASSFAACLKSPDPAVRTAAIAGLGELGDDSAVPALLKAAGSSDEGEMRAARQALLVLKRGDVTRALTARLAAGELPERIEAARTLAGRGDKEAGPALVAAARKSTDRVSAAVFSALGLLAEAKDIPVLVALTAGAATETFRDEAREALSVACARLRPEARAAAASALVNGLAGAGPEVRGALLQAGSGLFD